jgi:hypothetical protein
VASSDGNVLSSEAGELLCRRWYALKKTFAHVYCEGDWKQPKGEAGKKWRTKIDWRAMTEYDPQSLMGDSYEDEDAEEEVRKKMSRKALIQKAHDSLGPAVDPIAGPVIT